MADESDELRKAAEKQGWRVEPTTDGLMFYPANGLQPILIHRNPSDIAVKKFLSRARRSGLIWPLKG